MPNLISTIVADGMRRFRATPEFRAMRQRLLAEATQRHAPEFNSASWWRRLWLTAKIHYQTAAELKKRFPPGALHLTTQLR